MTDMPKRASRPKEARFSFRLPARLRERFFQQAEREDLAPAEWLRALIVRGLRLARGEKRAPAESFHKAGQ